MFDDLLTIFNNILRELPTLKGIADIATTVLVAVLIWQTFVLRRQLKDSEMEIGILRKQLELTREEFEHKSRPWIGHHEDIRDQGQWIDPSFRSYQLELVNYGEFPAQRCKVKFKNGSARMTRSEAEKADTTVYLGTIFPRMKRATGWLIPVKEIPNLADDFMLYVGVVIEYEYGSKNKKSLTGIIYEYDSIEQRLVIDDSWTTDLPNENTKQE